MGQSILGSLIPGMGGGQTAQPAPQTSGWPSFENPAQKVAYVMQAMRNPAAFVKQQFPDIPDEISNNPDAILEYLQRTRGISSAQIQQLSGQLFGNGLMR